MKIIQSYAHFDKGNIPRALNKDTIYLYFYSFLLSYLTLKKYYNDVTMYTNQSGYEQILKYVPYDRIDIIENENPPFFWSYYKIQIMNKMTEDFIHIDPDVFIFDDLFSEFIKFSKYDGIVQNKVPEKFNYFNDYVDRYSDFIIKNDLFYPEKYDGKLFSCGVIGMRSKIKNNYIDVCEKIKNKFIYDKFDKKIEANNSKFSGSIYAGVICEELAFYLFSIKNNLNIYEIIPYKDVVKYTVEEAGNKHKYTHMYINSKFNVKYVKFIRKKIINYFPKYLKYIEKYESDIMKNFSFFKEIC